MVAIETQCDDALFALVTEDDLWHIALATKAQVRLSSFPKALSRALIEEHDGLDFD